MTDTQTQNLGEFEGLPVLGTSVAITRAGDGLSQALKTDPVLLHHGQTVMVVLECEVADVTFAQIKDVEGFTRKHKLKAGTATIIDADVVRDAIVAQKERNQLAAEKAKGIQRLGQLEAEHAKGEHSFIDPVEGCSACDERKTDDDAKAADGAEWDAAVAAADATTPTTDKPKAKRGRGALSPVE